MAPARQILAIAVVPSRADAMALVASVTGFSLADVRLRLTGTLPRVLFSDTNVEHVWDLAAELEKHGFVALVCDPADAPGDGDRIVARQLELSSNGFVVTERNRARHQVSGGAITLLQRGWRSSTTKETVSTTERKVSLGRAVLSGGLLMTKKVKRSSEQVSESREAFLLVQRRDSQREIILYEQQLDYRFLGGEIQPAAHGNLMRTTERIRAIAPQARLDETVAQPGLVQKLEAFAVGDPLDLALYLVKLAHLRQRSA